MPLERALRQQCTKILSHHQPRTARDWLTTLAESPLADLELDVYGEGPAIALLEGEVAALLGKEAAVFIHKGVVAQQAALRVWADRTGHRTVALHPKSHIDADELAAYERLMGLAGARIGPEHAPFTARDLANINEPLAAIAVELPLRTAGFKLPTWSELEAISVWAHEHNVPLHFDGARLWESAPYYNRSLAEIAALADSVYVSFYKGLGGLGGCVLAGPADFIAAAKVWKTRLGGNLFTAFPYVITAYDGLKHYLPKMPGYYQRALEIAAALTAALPVQVAPDPPQTNSFQLFLPGTVSALEKAARIIAERDRVWISGYFRESAVPALSIIEIQVGDATAAWTTDEIIATIGELITLAAE